MFSLAPSIFLHIIHSKSDTEIYVSVFIGAGLFHQLGTGQETQVTSATPLVTPTSSCPGWTTSEKEQYQSLYAFIDTRGTCFAL